MATNGEFMSNSELSDKFGAGKMDGRGLMAHYNQAFIMEDEEVPMEVPNGIMQASEMNQEDEEDLYFELIIEDTDQRFGFSVMGGKEEGFLPKVDELVPGSPADRSDLHVGDEILAVNGKSLADASHAEVIAHIHQCVKSKTINLRVKRRPIGNSIESDPESRRIQEAYVIAVEQQTKDNIGHINNKNNVPTTDLANLPPLEQHPASAHNGYVEPNVTVNNNNKDEISSYASSDSLLDITHRKNSDFSGQLINGTVREPSVRAVRLSRQKRVKIDGWLSNSESSTDDYRDFDFDTSRTVTANVEIPPHGVRELPPVNTFIGDIVKEPHFESIELEAIKAPPDLTELEQKLASGDNLGLNNNVDGVVREDPDEMPREVPVDVPANFVVHSPNGMRNGREVAVDCPPSFVAASGMKNPPQQYHNSNNKHGNGKNHHANGPSNGVANGPTTTPMVNGTDHALINSHKNDVDNRTRKNNKQNAAHMQQQNDTARQKVPNDKRVVAAQPAPAVAASGKVALPPEQNVSQNNSQGATVFEPASTRPLFDGKASTSSSTDGEFTDNNKKTAVGLDELFSSLEHVQAKLGGTGDQTNVSFLQELFRNSDFQHAVSVHKQVEDIHRRPDPPLPHAADAEPLAEEILDLTHDTRNREIEELRRILDRPYFRSLLNTHDRIASRDPGLMLPAEEEDVFDHMSEDAEDSVKIVRIDKTAEPLGATILNDGDAVIIGRIVKGGMAERSGLLHEGDEILEINGQEVKGKSVNQICDIMSELTGTLTFLLIPSKEANRQPTRDQSTMVHVRAHFDYDPEDDMYIPCRELGLSFHKGDILHVINQEDSNWWQAYREGEEDQSLAGLIPSRNFQQQREAMKQTMPDDEEPKKKLLCGGKRKKKKKKKLYANPNDQESDEILTYEEISLYTPVNKKKRPIVLIGPPKVGRHELRQRLLENDERFAAAVPHTSRSKRDHETDGIDYHFVTKQRFEQDIVGGKFVEHGEFEKSIYGTSLDSIRSVVDTSKICILNLHPQALKILKNSNLKPYFIFVCPPQLDRLRQQRTEAGELLKEEELREIIETGRAMEDAYGHFFDYVIIHYDHDRAYTELLNEINRIQTEPSWVPSSWLH